KTFGEASRTGEDSGGGGHGHSHGLTDEYSLHEGHSHDGGGDTDTDSGAGETELSVNAGYQLTKRFSLNLGVAYSPGFGVGDPTAGVGYSRRTGKSMTWSGTFSATAPLSKTSKDNYKITTLTVGAGPTWTKGKYTL